MHIGVLTHNYPRFAGDFSGTFVEALCRELARQEQQVTVWAPFDAEYARPMTERHGNGLVDLQTYRYTWPDRAHQLGYMRSMQSDLALRANTYLLSPGFFAAGIRMVMREAARTRPDVLHAHWLLPNGYIGAVASKRLQIPLVVSVPGSDAQVAGKNPLFRRMARFTFQQASLLTANSAALRDAVVDLGADPAKFDMIIYGTDPGDLRPDTAGVNALRQQLGIDSTSAMLLCVGRMVHKKGFHVLLEAMACDHLRDLPLIAVMIGEGDQREEWQARARNLGIDNRVRWVGTVPKTEIARYYNSADMLIMPSISKPADGLNVCVLDAMSCAKPVIGSNVAGNPLAIVDGETGRIVREQDPAALAGAIAELVCDPVKREAMGRAGRRRIEAELGWPPLARRYIEHFARLAGRQ